MARDCSTYLFAGGGSGGHLFPGIAVAEELISRDPSSRVLFAGTDREVERRILAQHGYRNMALPSESFASFRRSPVRFPLRFWKSCRSARMLLEAESPRAVIGLGGYASAPTVIAATSLRIPTVLLEQNAVAGRATRWLSGRAGLVCLSFDETRGRFSSRANLCVTGNPVRREIASLAESASRRHAESSSDVRTILVLGGSQGAIAINEIMVHGLERLRGTMALRIVHQTGERRCQAVRAAYEEWGVDAVVQPFFDDLIAHYRRADVVVSRAGATTLAELACAGCPALLIPYPGSADDHQLWNARGYQDAGAACVVEQTADLQTAAEAVATQLSALLREDERRLQMGVQMRSLARPGATNEVIDRLEKIIAGQAVSDRAHGKQAAVVGHG